MQQQQQQPQQQIRISYTLWAAVKLSPRRQYEIAASARIHPVVLSQILIGAIPLKPNDPRVLAIAEQVGISPDEAFAS